MKKHVSSMLVAVSFASVTVISSVAGKPPSAAEAFSKGISLFQKQDYDAAIDAFTEAIRVNPKNASAYNNRGVAYHKKGEYDKAIADCGEAIRLNPKYFFSVPQPGSRLRV